MSVVSAGVGSRDNWLGPEIWVRNRKDAAASVHLSACALLQPPVHLVFRTSVPDDDAASG